MPVENISIVEVRQGPVGPEGPAGTNGTNGTDAEVTAANVLTAAQAMSSAQESSMRAAIGAANLVPELFHDFTVQPNGTVYQDGSLPIIGTAFQMIGDQATATVGNTTTESAVTAGAFSTGEFYVITTAGTTNFTAIGASANTVGVTFTATGAGSGTGTATPWRPALLPDTNSLYYLDCTLNGIVRNFAVEYVHKAISGGTGVTQSAIVLGISQAGVVASNLIHIRLVRNAVYVETGSPGSFSSVYAWVSSNSAGLGAMPLGVPTVSRIEIHGDTLLIYHEGRIHTVKHPDIESYNGSHVFVENTSVAATMNAQVGVLRLWGNAADGFFPDDSLWESYAHGTPRTPGRARFAESAFSWIAGATPTSSDDNGVATPGAVKAGKGHIAMPTPSSFNMVAPYYRDKITDEISSAAGGTGDGSALTSMNLDDYAISSGKTWRVEILGRTAANANTKRIKFTNYAFGDIAGLGAGVFFDTGNFTDNNKAFRIEVIKRRLSATYHAYTFIWQIGTTSAVSYAFSDSQQSAQALTFRTIGTAAGDLKFHQNQPEVREF